MHPAPSRGAAVNHKQQIMIAVGGNLPAAWLLDTMLWAARKTGDGDFVPWSLSKAADVAGMSYEQARRALRTLRQMGVVEGSRGGYKICLDNTPTVGIRRYDASASDGSYRRHPTVSHYAGGDMGDTGADRDQGKSLNDLLGIESEDPTPPKPAERRSLSLKPRASLTQDALDVLCRRKPNYGNVNELWRALNVRAGRHPSTGKAWKKVALDSALRDWDDPMNDLRFVYENWDRWRSYAKGETGMAAPKVPMLWHVGNNRMIVAGFRESGMVNEDDTGYSLADDFESRFRDDG